MSKNSIVAFPMERNSNVADINSYAADTTPHLPKLALTVNEAMHVISVRRTKLYSLIASGELRAFKCGKKTLFLYRDIHDFLGGLTPIRPKLACDKHLDKEG